jgi:regulator of sigma E protease
VLGIVVLFHELGHFIVAKLCGVRVLKFSIGFPPKMIGFKRGETEYCISWIPLGGYVKMAGENPLEGEELGDDPGNFMNKPPWKKALVFFAGPFANYLTAIVIAAGLFFILGKQVVDPEKVVVGAVSEGMPAEKIGLIPGDIIRSLGGKPIVSLNDLHKEVYPNPGASLNLVYERDGVVDSALIDIAGDTVLNLKGEKEIQGLIGIVQKSDTVGMDPLEAIVLANEYSWNMTVLMVTFLKKFITGEVSPKFVGGPIAIAKISGEKAREGFSSLLALIVLISINLAIINLLPIPVLDGGHLLFLAVEAVRRKPLTLKQKAIIQQIGLAFLLVIIILVTYNDIFGRLGQ